MNRRTNSHSTYRKRRDMADMRKFRDIDGEVIEIDNSEAWWTVQICVMSWLRKVYKLPTQKRTADTLGLLMYDLVDDVIKELRLEKYTIRG